MFHHALKNTDDAPIAPDGIVAWCTLLLALFGFASQCHALEQPFAASAAPPEAIGLVLGGGGARGAAHIGVLKVLERERVPIAFIAGTSMGAIVGGMYAAGYRAAEIEERLETTNWEEILRDAPRRQELPLERKNDSLDLLASVQLGIGMDGLKLPRGLIQGQKLLMTFQRHLLPVAHIRNFDQLAIPFRCVASNLADGSAVVFADGDLPFAIRASMSVPALFQPVRDREKRMLVDGMLASNVPVSVARGMGATRLIVIDVGEALLPTGELNSPISITNQVLSILLRDKTEAELATLGASDLLIRPELGDIGTADFPLTPQIIDMGELAAEQALAGIQSFSVDAQRYAQFAAQHQLPSYRAEKVAYIKVNSTRSRSSRNVKAQMSALLGKKLNVKRVERAIQAAYGDGRYERITYQAERDARGRLGLAVLPVDKGWGPNFLRFGFALDDDFAGESNYRLSAELRLTGRNKYGGEWRNRLDLGKEAGLRSEFLQPYGARSQFYLRPFLDTRTRLRQVGTVGERPFEFRTRSYGAGLEVGFDFDRDQRVSAELARGRDYARLALGSDDAFDSIDSDYGRLTLGFTRDTLDAPAFPHHGSRVDASYALYRRELGGDGDAQLLSIAADQAYSFGRHTFLYGARFSRPLGEEQPVFQALQSLGGLANLSGYTDDRLLGEAVGLARVVYYRRFGAADKLFSAPVYLGASVETGNAWSNVDDACVCDLLTAGSLFVGVDTFFGPMYLGYGRASSGSDTVYLSFGSLAFARR